MVKKYFDINDSTNFFLQQIEEYKININLYLFQRYNILLKLSSIE